MSSTNRGKARHTDDLYETPSWVTELLLQHEELGTPILECAVGRTKKILHVLERHYDRDEITGLEINDSFKPDICADYLKWVPDKEYKSIVTNPPFSSAIEFIKKSLEIVSNNGKVMMLLRLNFLESKERFKFWRSNMPARIIVLSERPKFYRGKTDSITYAWFIWDASTKVEKSELILVRKKDLDQTKQTTLG